MQDENSLHFRILLYYGINEDSVEDIESSYGKLMNNLSDYKKSFQALRLHESKNINQQGKIYLKSLKLEHLNKLDIYKKDFYDKKKIFEQHEQILISKKNKFILNINKHIEEANYLETILKKNMK